MNKKYVSYAEREQGGDLYVAASMKFSTWKTSWTFDLYPFKSPSSSDYSYIWRNIKLSRVKVCKYG